MGRDCDRLTTLRCLTHCRANEGQYISTIGISANIPSGAHIGAELVVTYGGHGDRIVEVKSHGNTVRGAATIKLTPEKPVAGSKLVG